jgi:hypothetical protein
LAWKTGKYARAPFIDSQSSHPFPFSDVRNPPV